MANIVQKAALVETLVRVGGTEGDELTLRLFANDFEPTGDDQADDFEEATFPGYEAVTGGWSAPANLGADAKSINSPTTVWTRGSSGSGNIVYGWFLTKDTDDGTIVLLAKRFAVPRPMTIEGQTLPLALTLIARRVGTS